MPTLSLLQRLEERKLAQWALTENRMVRWPTGW